MYTDGARAEEMPPPPPNHRHRQKLQLEVKHRAPYNHDTQLMAQHEFFFRTATKKQQTKGNNSARQTRDTTVKSWIANDSTWYASKYKVHTLHLTPLVLCRQLTITQPVCKCDWVITQSSVFWLAGLQRLQFPLQLHVTCLVVEWEHL